MFNYVENDFAFGRVTCGLNWIFSRSFVICVAASVDRC